MSDEPVVDPVVNPFVSTPSEASDPVSEKAAEDEAAAKWKALHSTPVSKSKDSKQSAKEACNQKIAAILAEHDNMESNIPVNHEYWGLISHYRSL
jgi:hypothetical protein